jgi:hypothetical protein
VIARTPFAIGHVSVPPADAGIDDGEFDHMSIIGPDGLLTLP